MQAAGMLRGTGAAASSLYLLGTLLLACVGDNAHALPLQLLPNIPGFIPVYIRLGDQPLHDINPALAEAFHEKAILENTPPENLNNAPGNAEKIPENHPSYDEVEEDDGLDTGSVKKDTIYLIGVRQWSGDKSRGEGDEAAPKIALPFEPVEAAAEDGQDRDGAEDAWIEEPGKSRGRPVARSKQAIKLQAGGLPADLRELEKLAADVEKEETRPNDVYDSTSANDRGESARRLESQIGKVPAAPRDPSEKTAAAAAAPGTNTDDDDLSEDTRPHPEEFRSGRSFAWDEALLRPARDPKESRPDEEATDFMEGEE